MFTVAILNLEWTVLFGSHRCSVTDLHHVQKTHVWTAFLQHWGHNPMWRRLEFKWGRLKCLVNYFLKMTANFFFFNLGLKTPDTI